MYEHELLVPNRFSRRQKKTYRYLYAYKCLYAHVRIWTFGAKQLLAPQKKRADTHKYKYLYAHVQNINFWRETGSRAAKKARSTGSWTSYARYVCICICMYVCMYVYIHTFGEFCVVACAQGHIHDVDVTVYIYIYIYIYTHIRTYMHTYIFIYTRTQICRAYVWRALCGGLC
jgi:hypothetical protein